MYSPLSDLDASVNGWARVTEVSVNNTKEKHIKDITQVLDDKITLQLKYTYKQNKNEPPGETVTHKIWKKMCYLKVWAVA